MDSERLVLRGGDVQGGVGRVLRVLGGSRGGVFVRGREGLLDRHGVRARWCEEQIPTA